MVEIKMPSGFALPEVGTELECTVRIGSAGEEGQVKGKVHSENGHVRLYDILKWYNGLIED